MLRLKMNGIFFRVFSLFLLITCFSFYVPEIWGEIIGSNLGVVNDLLVSNDSIYFFELNEDIQSPAWIRDTYVMTYTGGEVRPLSPELFAFPTELNEYGDYLIFSALSDECLGNIVCDYQDIIKMSKLDGSYSKITEYLKSAIHISVENEWIYFSESNGNIWKVFHDGSSISLINTGTNIIMDLTTDETHIYWIEEIEDQNSMILSIKDGEEPKIIAKNLKIPYDLRAEGGILHWNEIFVGPTPKGTIAEQTAIKTFHEDIIQTKAKFENTIPISSGNKSTYGPYWFYHEFLFLVNNTKTQSTIHLIEPNNTKYDIVTISEYDVKYLRNDNDNLYVVGSNEQGFIIERFVLPVPIPEFPYILLYATMFMSLSLTVFLKRFFHN